MDGHSIVQTTSLSAGRQIITKVLFGQPPKDIGIVGELVLDWMTQGFLDHILDGGITKQEFGSRVHKELKNKCMAFKPLGEVTVDCEPYFIKGGKTSGNPKGSLGVDVLIRYKEKSVIAFELKTGKGMTKSGIAKRQKWIGASVVQVTFKSTKG